ncbi:MAG: hypothetical protein NTU66_05940 [Elusimicrobia bacterium]|nr:hypothetical protein [Elusimicrobiota bacterium]
MKKFKLFSFSKDDANVLHDYFIGRKGVYAEQYEPDQSGKCGYSPVKESADIDTFYAHLRKKITIGIYTTRKDNTGKFLTLDIDGADAEQRVQKLKTACNSLGITDEQLLTELSGSKGYHVHMFFKEFIATELIYSLGCLIRQMSGVDCEQFPKQRSVGENSFGNLIKVPLGIHKATGKRCFFVDSSFKAYRTDQQISVLQSVKKLSRNDIVGIVSKHKDANPDRKHLKTAGNIEDHFKCYPCYQYLRNHPATKGKRDETAIRLAAFYRHFDVTIDETINRMLDWDKNNTPPMQDSESDKKRLVRTIQSAFKKPKEDKYFYRCKDPILQSICSDQNLNINCMAITATHVNCKPEYIVSKILPDGTMIEMVLNSTKQSSQFAVFKDGNLSYVKQVIIDGKTFLPYPPDHNLISNNIALFPSTAMHYGSQKILVKEIREFIRAYVTLSPTFELLSAYYVLLTWTYESFRAIPYLRVIGDYSCGKSRFLQTIGSLCYRAISTSGATTSAPIFRIIDKFHGTLVLDEGDLKVSDATIDMVKILNQGYEKGKPVLRCNTNNDNIPEAFNTFCPKIIATREEYTDRALESRCLTERMSGKMMSHVPFSTGSTFERKSAILRDKLLMWRFQNFGIKMPLLAISYAEVIPRLNQIIRPLMQVCKNIDDQRVIIQYMIDYGRQQMVDRRDTVEYEIFAIIESLKNEQEITVQAITEKLREGGDYPDFTPKKVGSIIRKKLNLLTERKNTGYIVIYSKELLNIMRLKYGTNSNFKRKFRLL